MSKFYSYEQLKDKPPSKKALAAAGQKVNELARQYNVVSVPYGSFAWGPRFYERRSDIDIAVLHEDALYDITDSEHTRYGSGCLDFALARFLLSNEAGIGIDIRFVGSQKEEWIGDPYGPQKDQTVIRSPIPVALIDQMKLLQRMFPERPYERFISAAMGKRKHLDRLDDFDSYMDHMSATLYMEDIYARTDPTFGEGNSDTLESLGKTENLPYHIIRRALGKIRMLPPVDSKRALRNRFFGVPQRWPIRQKFGAQFRRIFAASEKYETLLNSVVKGHITRDEYYQQLSTIKSVMKSAYLNIVNGYSDLIMIRDETNYGEHDFQKIQDFLDVEK